MSGNNYSISPATEADLPILARLLCNSKLTLTINRLLWVDWPNEELQLAKCTRAVEGSFNDPAAQNFKVVDDALGEVVGHLTFTTRERPAEPVKAKKKPGPEPGMDTEVLLAVGQAVTELSAARDDEHLELTHIYVAPSHRRRGIGSQLAQLYIERAGETALPRYFDSTPSAHEFFLSLGFKDTKHFEFDLSKWAPPYSGFGSFRLFGMTGSDST